MAKSDPSTLQIHRQQPLRSSRSRTDYEWGHCGSKAEIACRGGEDRRYVASCGSTTACYWGQERLVYGTVSYRW
jgi:hypothetical protein